MKYINKRTISILLLIILSTSCFLFSACNTSNKEIPTLAWQDMPENTNPNLKYMGLYHMSDYTQELMDMDIVDITKVDAREVNKIQEYYEAGYQIFIITRYVFFDNGELNANWQANWEKVKTDIEPYIDKILGFYIDEPWLTGKTKEAFHIACQTVREDFPNKKMMSVMALSSFKKMIVFDIAPIDYFDYCTDLAYDFYPNWNKNTIETQIEYFKNSRLREGQKMWLIPKAFYTVELPGDGNYLYDQNSQLEAGEERLKWIKGSYEIAVVDQDIVGIFAFVYSNGNFDLTLRDFLVEKLEHTDELTTEITLVSNENYSNEILGTYQQIGQAIIYNN